MKETLIYLLQLNLLLSFIYLSYRFLLKELTFYKLNRIYFLTGISYATLFPFLKINSWFGQHIQLPEVEITENIIFPANNKVMASYTFADLLLTIIAIGICLFFIKLLFQIGSLLRLHYHSQESRWKQYLYRHVFFPILPFSFFNKIYIHKEQHPEEELYDIFKHESIHVHGLHTLDILMCEILVIFCWYNPFVWLMRKTVHQNLEYLTDQQVLNKGTDRQAYQYSLLNTAKQGYSSEISNHFNFKALKKRIAMMNKKRSSKLELSKYILLFPFIILVGAGFTVKKVEKNIIQAVDFVQKTDLKYSIYPEAFTSGNSYTRVQDTLKSGKINLNQIDFNNNYLYTIDMNVVSADQFKKTDPHLLDYTTFNPKGTFKLPSVDNYDSYDGLVSVFTKKHTAKSKEKLKKALFVLDGEIMNDEKFTAESVDPNSIESMEILKDDAAKAVYGEEAKDGVIIITTKKINR